jgi:hypothetical protein
MKIDEISDVHVMRSGDDYLSTASVTVAGNSQSRQFKLLIPPSAFGRIEFRLGRRFGSSDIERLFRTHIAQSIENRVLRSYPASAPTIDLGVLDYRQVDSLI